MSFTTFPLNESMFIRPRLLPLSAWTGHIPFGAWLIRCMRPSVVVELGTHRGASFLSFCQAVEEASLSTRCYAVDTWLGDEHAGEYEDAIYNELNAYHQPLYGGFSQLMRMTFDEASGYFSDGDVDLLHIDGLHTYEAVSHDFATWKGKLSSKAVVVFHDVHVKERNFGVWKLWQELKGQYPNFEFPHSHGLGVLLVGSDVAEVLNCLKVDGESEEAKSICRLFDSLGARLKSDFQVSGLVKEIESRAADIHELHSIITRLNREASDRIGELHARDAAVHELSRAVGEMKGQLDSLGMQLDGRIGEVLAEVRPDAYIDSGAVDSFATSLRSSMEKVMSAFDEQRSKSFALLLELSNKSERDSKVASELYLRRVSDLESAIFEKNATITGLESNIATYAIDLQQLRENMRGAEQRVSGLEAELESGTAIQRELQEKRRILQASSFRPWQICQKCRLRSKQATHASPRRRDRCPSATNPYVSCGRSWLRCPRLWTTTGWLGTRSCGRGFRRASAG